MALPSTSASHTPAFMLSGIWDELERAGMCMHDLERLSGIPRPSPGDVSSLVPEANAARLFEAARTLSGDDAIGLKIGHALGLESFDLVGHLALASGSLEQAVALVERALVQFHGGVATIEQHARGRMRVGYRRRDEACSLGARIRAEMSASLLYKFVQPFLAPAYGPPTVELPFPAPADLRRYRAQFEGALVFDAAGTFCSFPSAALVRRRSGTDDSLTGHLLLLAQQRFGARAEQTQDWTSRARRVLEAQPVPLQTSLRELARLLGLTPRGVTRRLSVEGTTFRALVEAATFERAQTLLQHPGAAAVDVAAQLGFANAASFFRAFKRWSGGATPKQYARKQVGVLAKAR